MAEVIIDISPIPPVTIGLNPVPPVKIDMLPNPVYGPFNPLVNVVDDWPDTLVEGEFYIKLNP